jgi:hypothetical protein
VEHRLVPPLVAVLLDERERNANAGSAGCSAGSGTRASIFSMIGVESCIAVSSGATTSGISGSFA